MVTTEWFLFSQRRLIFLQIIIWQLIYDIIYWFFISIHAVVGSIEYNILIVINNSFLYRPKSFVKFQHSVSNNRLIKRLQLCIYFWWWTKKFYHIVLTTRIFINTELRNVSQITANKLTTTSLRLIIVWEFLPTIL